MPENQLFQKSAKNGAMFSLNSKTYRMYKKELIYIDRSVLSFQYTFLNYKRPRKSATARFSDIHYASIILVKYFV